MVEDESLGTGKGGSRKTEEKPEDGGEAGRQLGGSAVYVEEVVKSLGATTTEPWRARDQPATAGIPASIADSLTDGLTETFFSTLTASPKQCGNKDSFPQTVWQQRQLPPNSVATESAAFTLAVSVDTGSASTSYRCHDLCFPLLCIWPALHGYHSNTAHSSEKTSNKQQQA